MDLEVVGRHALLFDDDGMAAFVNSGDALVDWNSLQIDRYDVRHLLSAPPPPRKRFHSSSSLVDSSLQFELDLERYLDLPPTSAEPEVEEGERSVDAGYRAVGFSYGNTDDSADRSSEVGVESSEFRPSFPVPETLHCLPPTEKVHQIIARTALFVSKHGGQSEIVLRVKQGDNPTFGFLMPDHELHGYFRFLVDHPELLQSDSNFKAQNEGKNASNENKEHDGVGGALSLLGSVYGSGEDEEPAFGYDPGSRVSSEAFDALDSTNISCPLERAEASSKACQKDEKEKDEKVSTHSRRSIKDKERPPTSKKNNLINASKSGSSSKRDDFGSSAASEKTKAEGSGLGVVSKTGPLVEPPSDLKRLIDKIVEFILKNGKQFESTLMEQDSRHGRFPFLLPSNQYHPYYLKVLHKAQESKVHGPEKRVSLEESHSSSLRPAGYDLPYVFDKKEKFTMVIGKSKKDMEDSLNRTSQQEVGVNVDAAAAAAILQAATRGIKNPNLSVISGSSKNGDSRGHSSEGGQASTLFNGPPSGPNIIGQKSDQRMEHSLLIPKAKEIAKSAAAEAASEADSSEAHLSKEQKLKADRLRRAKMFVALLKSGAAPVKRDSSHGGSVEQQESALSGSGTEVKVTKEREGSAAPSELTAVEREGSAAPLIINRSKENEESEMKQIAEEHERRARRKYRSRSGRHEEEDEEDEEEEEQQLQRSRKKHRSSREDEESGVARDDKRSKRKRRSHRHTHKDGDNAADKDESDGDKRRSRKKHHRRHSSPHEYDDDDERGDAERHHKLGRKSHSSRRSSHRNRRDDYEEDYKPSKKKHRSPRTSLRSRDRHENRTKHFSDDESDRSRRTSHRNRDRHGHRTKHSSDGESECENKLASCSNDEEQHYGKDDKNEKGIKEREELEEGEIRTKVSDQSRGSMGGSVSREASVDVSSSRQKALSQPSESTEVSDDLRAKIRAMLMATRQ